MIYGLTQSGFRTKLYEDIFDEMKEEFLKDFPSANTRDDNPAIIFLKVTAMQAARLWESLESVYNSKYVSTATGVSLDFLCKTIGISRRGKTNATGKVKVRNISSETIELPNKLVFESEYGTKYESINFTGVTLDKDNRGICEVEVKSIGEGEKYNLEKGRIKSLLGSVGNKVEVTNQEAILGGQDIERDYELRQRYYESVSKSGGANLKSIVAAVQQNTGAKKVVGLENDKDEIDKETNLPPHSIEIIVSGGDSKEIAETIYKKKSAGVRTCGFIETISGSKVVLEPAEPIIIDGNEVRFTRATSSELLIAITLDVDKDKFFSDYEKVIKKNLQNYINSIEMGGIINANQMSAQLYIGTEGILKSDLKFGFGKADNNEDIKLGLRSLPIIKENSIKIEFKLGIGG